MHGTFTAPIDHAPVLALPASTTSRASAHARISLTYLWRHGRLPDLDNPQRFTERVQVRKLCDRAPEFTQLMDKLAAKALAGQVLGKDWVIPTLWADEHLPDTPPFIFPAIVKARHGCNQYAALRTALNAAKWRHLQRRARRWIAKPYGLWLDEWAYRNVPRAVLAEPLVGNGPDLPIDYKIYVFGGRATHVQVHLGRAGAHRWILHDRNWGQLVKSADCPPPPQSLGAMLDAAEALAAGRDFLRVDFYEIDGKPLFGEFCLYPGSGLDPFAADWVDFELGALWREAQLKR